ncbi:hypothetical protein BS78_03G274200 [Paspalum vaginatum]|nr:hypothetical protein BS78_03G274200 [Paspalum vaginatum]
MVMEDATTDGEMSLSNMVLGFFEDFERERRPENDGADDEEGSSSGGDTAESKAFWQTQHSQLHEALAKTSTAERRIRADAEEAIKGMRAAAAASCSCTGQPAARDCRLCMLRHVAQRLRDAGYNSAVCKSKWTRSPDIPSGEHSYVDVVAQTRSGKAVRVVVELSFRAEFEVARASAGYRALVTALPEAFVGRAERLRGVVKVMCAAAKQCMKENNMHMGPWRKHKYMQAKWLGTPERAGAVPAADVAAAAVAPVVPSVTVGASPDKQTKFRASMLTFDFGRTAVEVA